MQFLNLHHKLINCNLALSEKNHHSSIVELFQPLHSKFFVILQFLGKFLDYLPEKLCLSFRVRHIANSFPSSLVSQLVRLAKVRPLGLELHDKCQKSNISIQHYPFSSVQFRPGIRKSCLSCALSLKSMFNFSSHGGLCSDRVLSLSC